MSHRVPGTEDPDITLPVGAPDAAFARSPGRPSAYCVESSALTHKGLVRDHNEDDYTVIPERGVYLVADGMGGHNAGRVAAELCVGSVREYFGSVQLEGEGDHTLYGRVSAEACELVDSLRLANRAIFEASLREREYAGMGTTAVAVRFYADQVAVAHAGDSRCYLAREGRMAQVTIDHSLVNFLYELNREFEAQVAEMHMSNVIMRAVGLEPEAQIEVVEFEAREGDRLLLCSDGLSDLVSTERMAELLYDDRLDREAIAQELLNEALAAGGRDNITVMIVDVLDGLDTPKLRRDANDTVVVEAAADDDAEMPPAGSGALADDD